MENEELLKALSVLSESTRTEILFTIASEGELRAKDVLKKFDITQPTLSHHLNFLLENEIIRSRKEGRCVWYSVNKEMMLELSDLLKKLADPKTAAKIEKAPEQPKVKAKSPAKKSTGTPSLKKNSSVPKLKQKVEAPDIEELKKKKKKKSEKDKKKKDKKKKK